MNPNRVQLLVRFGYAGDWFHGVQEQRDLPTAAGALRQRLLEAFLQRPRAFNIAARTDAEVTALGNLATCWFEAPIELDNGLRRLGEPRLDGLFGVEGFHVPTSVHARNVGIGKVYRYVIEDGAPVGFNSDLYLWRITPRLHGPWLREAAAALVGAHDFSSFRSPRCTAGSPHKKVAWVRVDGPWVGPQGQQRFVIEIAADAFVRKMIRIIVGTLAEIGTGLRPPETMAEILAARQRDSAGMTAPARGLMLVRVLLPQPNA